MEIKQITKDILYWTCATPFIIGGLYGAVNQNHNIMIFSGLTTLFIGLILVIILNYKVNKQSSWFKKEDKE